VQRYLRPIRPHNGALRQDVSVVDVELKPEGTRRPGARENDGGRGGSPPGNMCDSREHTGGTYKTPAWLARRVFRSSRDRIVSRDRIARENSFFLTAAGWHIWNIIPHVHVLGHQKHKSHFKTSHKLGSPHSDCCICTTRRRRAQAALRLSSHGPTALAGIN
jgi:hypothetical protein